MKQAEHPKLSLLSLTIPTSAPKCSNICLACQSSRLSLFLLGFHLQCIWVTVKVLDLVY